MSETTTVAGTVKLGAVTEQERAVVRGALASGRTAAATIAEETGVGRVQVSRVLRTMVETGEVVRTGVKRATRYRLAGTTVAPAPIGDAE